MKIYQITLFILLILFLAEGFRGEFYNPTIFDFVKWIAWILASIVYVICRRRKKSCD